LHMAQLMPLPLTVSCFSKIQTGFTFLVPAHPVVADKGPLNVCVCVCVSYGPSCFRLDFPLNISIHSIIYVEAAVALGLVVVRRRRSARYMHSTGCGLLLHMSRGLSRTGRARVFVCWMRARALPKRPNRSRCRLTCGLAWARGIRYKVGALTPTHGKGHFWGHLGLSGLAGDAINNVG